MRLSAMGDVAMIVPLLRAFNQKYPTVKITVISTPFFQPLFNDIPNVHFLPFDKDGKHKGFLGLFRLFLDLRKCNIDAFADLHNVLRIKVFRILLAITGKKIAFTHKGRSEKKEVTRAVNKIFRPLPTVFERHAKVFSALGFPINLSNPTFPEKSIMVALLNAASPTLKFKTSVIGTGKTSTKLALEIFTSVASVLDLSVEGVNLYQLILTPPAGK